jgi:hypothetical protein
MATQKRKPAPKTAPPIPRRKRAADIGVSIQCLSNWERCGVDVFDDEQIRAKISRLRNIPPTLKPEWHPKVLAAVAPANTDDPTTIDIEAIISQLAGVTDKHQAQTVKIQIDGLLNAYKLREAAGKYVSRAKVEEDLIRIGAAVKGSLLRMEADLPPMLEGMTPAKMQKTIRQKVDEVLSTLSDASSSIWHDDE